MKMSSPPPSLPPPPPFFLQMSPCQSVTFHRVIPAEFGPSDRGTMFDHHSAENPCLYCTTAITKKCRIPTYTRPANLFDKWFILVCLSQPHLFRVLERGSKTEPTAVSAQQQAQRTKKVELSDSPMSLFKKKMLASTLFTTPRVCALKLRKH